jgi:hypothetical protein
MTESSLKTVYIMKGLIIVKVNIREIKKLSKINVRVSTYKGLIGDLDSLKEDLQIDLTKLDAGIYQYGKERFQILIVDNDKTIIFEKAEGKLAEYIEKNYRDLEDAYIQSMEEHYDFYHGIDNSECSSCRGGGCIHCKPSWFI